MAEASESVQPVTSAVECYGCGAVSIFTAFLPVQSNQRQRCSQCNATLLAFRDFKYDRAASWNIAKSVITSGVQTSQFQRPLQAAIQNLDRLVKLSRLPLFLTHWGRLKQLVDSIAWADVFGNFIIDTQKEIDASPEEKARLFQVRSDVMQEYRKLLPGFNYLAGTQDLNRILASPFDSLFITGALDAMLSSLVVGSYTAFESFAEDLWIAAVNTHPHGLSDLKGRRKKNSAGTDPDDEAENGEKRKSASGEQGKLIPLELLQKHGYDLRGVMGNLLGSKQEFDSMGGIRDAYTQAFYRDRDDIDRILWDERLGELNAVRNNIIHSGGIVDAELFNTGRATRLKRDYAIEIGAPLPLDGQIVGDMMRLSVEACAGLARAVDEWIRKNPPKTK